MTDAELAKVKERTKRDDASLRIAQQRPADWYEVYLDRESLLAEVERLRANEAHAVRDAMEKYAEMCRGFDALQAAIRAAIPKEGK